MIHSLLVPDYKIHEISSVIGMISMIVLMATTTQRVHQDTNNALFLTTLILGEGCVATSWPNLIIYNGWKVITDQDIIARRILQRNSTHLFMSGESPFARGLLAEDIGKDGEGTAVDEI